MKSLFHMCLFTFCNKFVSIVVFCIDYNICINILAPYAEYYYFTLKFSFILWKRNNCIFVLKSFNDNYLFPTTLCNFRPGRDFYTYSLCLLNKVLLFYVHENKLNRKNLLLWFIIFLCKIIFKSFKWIYQKCLYCLCFTST